MEYFEHWRNGNKMASLQSVRWRHRWSSKWLKVHLNFCVHRRFCFICFVLFFGFLGFFFFFKLRILFKVRSKMHSYLFNRIKIVGLVPCLSLFEQFLSAMTHARPWGGCVWLVANSLDWKYWLIDRLIDRWMDGWIDGFFVFLLSIFFF